MRRRESGIAALTAILIVAVAASAAAMMLSQQSAMLDQTMLVASRAQAEQYATAGLDWARGVLSEDARNGGIDSLDEGWAKPIVGMPIERAVVAGAIGYFGYNGNLDTCIVIRTIVMKGKKVYITAGAGIVADSIPANEYQETLNKARGLLRSIELTRQRTVLGAPRT